MPDQTCIRKSAVAPSNRSSCSKSSKPKKSSCTKSAPSLLADEIRSASPLIIKTITLTNGERFPLLLQRADMTPLFTPTAYLVSCPRMRGNQSNTLLAHLRAIKFLYLWAILRGFDIEQRFETGHFFKKTEIEDLLGESRSHADVLLEKVLAKGRGARTKVAPLTRLKKTSRARETVEEETVALRLFFISSYLKWLGEHSLGRLALPKPDKVRFETELAMMLAGIEAMIPSTASPGRVTLTKMGLEKQTEKLLLDVIDPLSPMNPWHHMRVKERNHVLIKLLLGTGMRKGEALGLKMEDLWFGKNKLAIHRTPNDPVDPRRHKPNTKTLARLADMTGELRKMLRDYCIDCRSRGLPAADKHPFVFVQTRTGTPLTSGGFDRIIKTLKEKVPDIPDGFCAHLLRHTWNDNFSRETGEKIKTGKMTIKEEEVIRKNMMGWSSKSKMPEHYSQRHIQEKAQEVSISLQNFGKEEKGGDA